MYIYPSFFFFFFLDQNKDESLSRTTENVSFFLLTTSVHLFFNPLSIILYSMWKILHLIVYFHHCGAAQISLKSRSPSRAMGRAQYCDSAEPGCGTVWSIFTSCSRAWMGSVRSWSGISWLACKAVLPNPCAWHTETNTATAAVKPSRESKSALYNDITEIGPQPS